MICAVQCLSILVVRADDRNVTEIYKFCDIQLDLDLDKGKNQTVRIKRPNLDVEIYVQAIIYIKYTVDS